MPEDRGDHIPQKVDLDKPKQTDTKPAITAKTDADNKTDSGVATAEEIARAKSGVEEFKNVFSNSSMPAREFLGSRGEGEKLQLIFLGVKPVSAINYKYMQVRDELPLPERFGLAGSLLYDRDLVQKTIAENPDIFTDFDGDIDAYMQSLEDRQAIIGDNSSSPDAVKIGILFGFPKNSALDFAKHSEDHDRLFEELRHLYPFGYDPEDQELARNLGYIIYSGKYEMNTENRRKMDEYRLANKQAVRDFWDKYFSDYNFYNADLREYMTNSRNVSAHGMQYGDSSPEDGDPELVRKINQLYDESGIQSVLREKGSTFPRIGRVKNITRH